MLRVAGTYRAYGLEYDERKNDLFRWTSEILDAMYAHTALANTTLFHNYVDQDATFLDASSTAAIAAATYHLAVLSDGKGLNRDRLSDAERARQELGFGGHIGGNGWLSPVVDPYNFPKQGSHSAEAQAFVVSMYAGYRAWQVADGSSAEGSSAESPSASSASHAGAGAGAVAALAALICILGISASWLRLEAPSGATGTPDAARSSGFSGPSSLYHLLYST
jgi:hypothetical protein